jgi:hypothetical protein
MNAERILDAAAAAVREAERRSGGDPPDRRFDIPLAMLEDLAEELFLEPTGVYEVRIPETGLDAVAAARRAECTNDGECDALVHLPACPRRR